MKLLSIQPARAKVLLSLFCCSFLIIACARSQQAPVVAYHGETMGTTYSIKIVVDEATVAAAEKTQITVDALLEAFNQSLSTYIPDSEIAKINEAPAGQWLLVSPRFMSVLVLSNSINELSAGAFDPTVGPLVNLWGFGSDHKANSIPKDADILAAQKRVGLGNIEFDRATLRLKKLEPVELDFSAVAKGYAVDEVAQHLLNQGYSNFMVEIGGELRVSGRKLSGELWRIGVESPSASGTIRPISISNVGVATSGDYRNYFEEGGVRYSHTIDPNTGRPITHNLASITVVADTAAKADALATAYSVMGGNQALLSATEHKHAIYLIERSGGEFNVRYSEAFKTFLEPEN